MLSIGSKGYHVLVACSSIHLEVLFLQIRFVLKTSQLTSVLHPLLSLFVHVTILSQTEDSLRPVPEI